MAIDDLATWRYLVTQSINSLESMKAASVALIIQHTANNRVKLPVGDWEAHLEDCCLIEVIES